jgi:sortase A
VDDAVLTAPPADAPPPRTGMSTGDKVRFVLRGIGQTLITAGLVVLLFVVYEVWITNLFADRNNTRNIAAIKKVWAKNPDTISGGSVPLPGDKVSAIPVGSGLGILYIPRFGQDYHEFIVQGGNPPDDHALQQGVAHYGQTQMPGQKGNFAVAGHRVGKGEPFLNLDKLRSGDAVVVETKTTWFVYRVKGGTPGGDPQTDPVDADGIPGRMIVTPDDGNVLAPVPNQPTIPVAKATERLMTMTTCHPKFTASHRMIVFAKLASSVAADGTAMPAAISALYNEVST